MSNYNDGWSAGHKVGYDAGRVEGQTEIWELVKKIYCSNGNDLRAIFKDFSGISDIFFSYTPGEALSIYNEYFEKKKIKRGDYVAWKCGNDEGVGIMLYEQAQQYIILCDNITCPQFMYKRDTKLKKLDKHIDLDGLFAGVKDKE